MDTKRVSIYASKSLLLLGLLSQAACTAIPQSPLVSLVNEMARIYQEMMPHMQAHQLEKESISLANLNLEHVLERMVEEQDTVSPEFAKCYAELANGVTTMTLGEMMKVMPELIDFARQEAEKASGAPRSPPSDSDRAPRPGASSPTATNAIVGKEGCDLVPVLATISSIKKLIIRLEKVICEKIKELEELICDKFEQTWTILAKIEDDIFDTQSIICDKF